MFKFNLKKNIKNKACPAKLKRSGGFTLLEALVATSILMVAVAAPITIAQKGLSSAVYSKNQMIASYLAQDAIEYIKNVRDENFISNIGILPADQKDWLTGLNDECVGADKWCAVDTKATDDGVNIGKIISDETLKLSKEKDNNNNFQFFGYEPGEETNFTRKINIQTSQINGKDDQALITVIVSWNGGEVPVKTLIYNI